MFQMLSPLRRLNTPFLVGSSTPPAHYLFYLLFTLHSSAVNAEAVPVTVTKTVHAELSEDIALTGTVTSPQIATLSAAVSGLVEALHVDIGARVEPGALLIELDSELAKIALQGARASLESAQATYKEAQRKVDEARPLVKQNNIAATEMSTRESQASIAKAAVDRATADVNQRSAELARHQVRAPFAGVISRKLTEQGEWVSPGREVLELVATRNLRLDFQVPQDVYPRLSDQAKIMVRFDAVPQQRYEAKMLSTVPVNNPNARTFLLRAELTDATPNITSGMSTSGVLQLHATDKGVLAPRDAVLRYADGRIVVWVVNQSGDQPIVEERVVTLGVSSAGQVEIRSGLTAAEIIVTRGNEALQPGQAVSIVEQVSIDSAK